MHHYYHHHYCYYHHYYISVDCGTVYIIMGINLTWQQFRWNQTKQKWKSYVRYLCARERTLSHPDNKHGVAHGKWPCGDLATWCARSAVLSTPVRDTGTRGEERKNRSDNQTSMWTRPWYWISKGCFRWSFCFQSPFDFFYALLVFVTCKLRVYMPLVFLLSCNPDFGGSVILRTLRLGRKT